MSAMTCSAMRDLACELALDLLGGDERAAALAHIETCAPCRQDVALLTDAVDGLLQLTPGREPSAGFEDRVIEQIDRLATAEATPRRRHASRRPSTVRRILAVAAAAIVIATTGLFLTAALDGRTAEARTADMRTSTGQVVGHVTMDAEAASIRLTIPDWPGLVRTYGATVDAPYWLDVETADNSRDLVRLPSAEQDPWTVPISTDPSLVTTVALVDNTGNIWCTARIPR